MQYRPFVDAEDGYHNDAWWQDLERRVESGDLQWAFANYPAINVSWFDAVAFCRWLSAKRNLMIRLPTEWEWQWAAVGNTEGDYPWGNPWHPARANNRKAGIGRTVAAGLYPLSRGPFGIDDMAGNVWQWCLNAHDHSKDIALMSDKDRVVRDGSWYDNPDLVRSSVRVSPHPGHRRSSLGFRVLCSSLIIETRPTAPLNAEKLAY